MTRCQTCFHFEQFCNCRSLDADTQKLMDESIHASPNTSWLAAVQQQAHARRPLLPIDLKFQRVAAAAFN